MLAREPRPLQGQRRRCCCRVGRVLGKDFPQGLTAAACPFTRCWCAGTAPAAPIRAVRLPLGLLGVSQAPSLLCRCRRRHPLILSTKRCPCCSVGPAALPPWHQVPGARPPGPVPPHPRCVAGINCASAAPAAVPNASVPAEWLPHPSTVERVRCCCCCCCSCKHCCPLVPPCGCCSAEALQVAAVLRRCRWRQCWECCPCVPDASNMPLMAAANRALSCLLFPHTCVSMHFPSADNEPLKAAMASAADLHARIYQSYNLPYEVTPGACCRHWNSCSLLACLCLRQTGVRAACKAANLLTAGAGRACAIHARRFCTCLLSRCWTWRPCC